MATDPVPGLFLTGAGVANPYALPPPPTSS